MLAAAAPTGKLAPDTTPERRSGAQDIGQGLTIFRNLVERIQNAADAQRPIHRVEQIIFRDVLAMGLAPLRSLLTASGDGDVGPTLTIPGERPDEPPHVLTRLDEPRSRPYLSVFGEVTIERVGYGHDRLDAAPRDARLHLPRRQHSSLLRRWLGAFVIDDAHAEAARKLQMIPGIAIPVKASEDLNREQAGDVELVPGSPAGARAEPGGVARGGHGRLQGRAVAPLGPGRRCGGGGGGSGDGPLVRAAPSPGQG